MAIRCGMQANPAHPRSRGENQAGRRSGRLQLGSSPLTRGKLRVALPVPFGHGLIPAHAGKTSRRADRAGQSRAHPRSRGENPAGQTLRGLATGSSPLTRGKPEHLGYPRQRKRLIPAHAGKTQKSGRPPSWRTAHPRSRGENNHPRSWTVEFGGSSPLTRGKPSHCRFERCGGRLIPAHAGKTEARAALYAREAAHPRSRGENTFM